MLSIDKIRRNAAVIYGNPDLLHSDGRGLAQTGMGLYQTGFVGRGMIPPRGSGYFYDGLIPMGATLNELRAMDRSPAAIAADEKKRRGGAYVTDALLPYDITLDDIDTAVKVADLRKKKKRAEKMADRSPEDLAKARRKRWAKLSAEQAEEAESRYERKLAKSLLPLLN